MTLYNTKIIKRKREVFKHSLKKIKNIKFLKKFELKHTKNWLVLQTGILKMKLFQPLPGFFLGFQDFRNTPFFISITFIGIIRMKVAKFYHNAKHTLKPEKFLKSKN